MKVGRRNIHAWMGILPVGALVVGLFAFRSVLFPADVALTQPPTISDFKPTLGGEGTVVRVRGTHLGEAVSVLFNGTPALDFTLISESAIDVVVPPGATTGSISVKHGGQFRSADTFTVKPKPTLKAVSMYSAGVRATITLTGTNLTDVKTVAFNGQRARVFNVRSATEIEVAVPVGATTGKITVTSSGGVAETHDVFNVLPPPVLESSSLIESGVGATVTLTGTNLTGATEVAFGGVPATSFAVVSSTSISAVVPEGATSGPILVTTPGGRATRPRFKLYEAPVITSLSVKSGKVGTVVSISGLNFSHGSTVSFNGAPATTPTVATFHIIRVAVPAGATTGPLVVNGPGGATPDEVIFIVLAG